MNDIILLKLGEIVLKGLNRKSFEQKLLANVRRRLAPIGDFRVCCMQSTVYVEGAEGADMDAAFEALQKVFGIINLTRAAGCEKNKEAIARLAIDYLRDEMEKAKSFKVESRRADKTYPMTLTQESLCGPEGLQAAGKYDLSALMTLLEGMGLLDYVGEDERDVVTAVLSGDYELRWDMESGNMAFTASRVSARAVPGKAIWPLGSTWPGRMALR